MNKYKVLILFELSKIVIAFLNISFLLQSHPALSLTISIISIWTSTAAAVAAAGGAAVAAGGAAVAAVGAVGAVVGGAAVAAVAAVGAVAGGAAVAAAVAAAAVAVGYVGETNKNQKGGETHGRQNNKLARRRIKRT